MNKNNGNLILAIVFLLGFLYLWQTLVVSKYAPPKTAASKTQTLSDDAKENAKLSALADEAARMPASKTPQDTILKLTAPHVEAIFDSATGTVQSWKIEERDHWVEMVLPEKNRPNSPLTLTPPLSYIAKKMSESQAEFQATRPDGVIVHKSVSLLSQPPFHSVVVEFSNPTDRDADIHSELLWGNGIDKHKVGTPYDPKGSPILAEQRAAAFDGKAKRWHPGIIFGRTVDFEQAGAFDWVGVGNNHFLAAFLADGDKIPSIKVFANRKTPAIAGVRYNMTLKPKTAYTEKMLLYVGAKNYDELKKVGYNLDQAVDFGLFGVISKVLLLLLNKFESITGNYGWAIILLTFCIQIVVLPLTIKNFKHSARMKELQPQLKKLQDQFKSDPKRMQVETFNLYRKNGMKFMGMEGCFPVLLQIPLFFAFYSTLNVAYELRGAPWIFWIHDLAAQDPHYVLPIIMGLGMFLQQKLTAVAMDPAQARMMLFMPVMFTFMFFKLPAGLVLYWCVNSLTNIAIQSVMKKQGASPTAAA